MKTYTRTFTQQPGAEPFTAMHDAERWLKALGFSYGTLQRGAPIGILHGEWTISKWRNMTAAEQRELHGAITSADFREGPVIVGLRETCPALAMVAVLADPLVKDQG